VIGRLVERKGVPTWSPRWPSCPVSTCWSPVAVRGGTRARPEAVRLRELAEANGTADRLHLLGSVPRAEMPDLLARPTSSSPCRGTSRSGSSRSRRWPAGDRGRLAVGGLLDTVVPGVTGDLVPPRRPDLLAATLRALLATPPPRAYAQEGCAGCAPATTGSG
jgi:glycosyltransferase involved in cell wall biosynthesis